MGRIGIPCDYIKVVFALYTSTSSRVLVGGALRNNFLITRSVRQGCPLAPYLFLFVGEAFSAFLHKNRLSIKGIQWPSVEEVVLAYEFADDTTLYVVGDDRNLCNVQNVIYDFSDASGAIINWHKSVGFWVGEGLAPIWCLDIGFRWIPKGSPVRYLGCQVGINLPPDAHIQPLLLPLRKKLIFWSSKNLSLAGRLVISNKVLLSSMWYILSS